MRFKAEVKYYDPDHEYEAEFGTWAEAEEWFRQQRQFGLCSMWLNHERVKFSGGVLVNDESFDHTSTAEEKPFRPQPTRGMAPQNPATRGERV